MSEKPVKVLKRKNIHLVNEENDIKFRGPLSYRHLRILGWIFLIVSQIGVILELATTAGVAQVDVTFLIIIRSASSLMTPLFLIAAFAQVLVAKDGYRRLLRTYILGAIGIYLLFIIVYLHFGVGLMSAFMGGWEAAYEASKEFVSKLNDSGLLSFNIFIDLILCALVTFFLNYHPKKYFQGKKIILFRLFAILPLVYEAISIILKICSSGGLFNLSPFVIPLLTTKPPVAFFLFILLALFVKTRERYYIKQGKSHEEYQKFLNTNVNRFHFSLYLSFTILGAVILDIGLMLLIYFIKTSSITPDMDASVVNEIIEKARNSTYVLGFGKCIPMVLIIPIVMFFDYTKTYKNTLVDIVIPVVGIGLIALAYVEGFFEIGKAFFSTHSEIINNEEGKTFMLRSSVLPFYDKCKNFFLNHLFK